MIAAVLLILVVVLYRVVLGVAGMHEVQWLHNFAPLAAVALCGALYLPRRFAAALPLTALLVSDVLLNLSYARPLLTWEIVPRYFALALIVGLGFLLRGKVRLPGLLGASFAGSMIFYFITNTRSWLGQAAYAKTFAGWVQAMTVGEAGWPSTIWFYRHTLVSDLLFTALFAACLAWGRKPAPALAPRAEAPALS